MNAARAAIRGLLLVYHMLGFATLAAAILAAACWSGDAAFPNASPDLDVERPRTFN